MSGETQIIVERLPSKDEIEARFNKNIAELWQQDRNELDQLRADNERLNAIVLDYENREASVCPENTPFEDVIKRLKGEVETLKKCLFQMQNAAKDLTDTLATYKAAAVEAREALEKWKSYYESELQNCDEEITRYTKEQDFHGVNFHQGRRCGIIQHDIGLQPLKDALHTLSALTGDATPNPLKSHSL